MVEVVYVDFFFVVMCGEQGCFVVEVGQVCIGEVWGILCDYYWFDVVSQWQFVYVDFQDVFVVFYVWQVDYDLVVEMVWMQQCRVQYVGVVGCGDYDYVFVIFEVIYFDQQLVQGLFVFVMIVVQVGVMVVIDGVDFVDEDDVWGVFFGLFEYVMYVIGVDVDEYFYEV